MFLRKNIKFLSHLLFKIWYKYIEKIKKKLLRMDFELQYDQLKSNYTNPNSPSV